MKTKLLKSNLARTLMVLSVLIFSNAAFAEVQLCLTKEVSNDGINWEDANTEAEAVLISGTAYYRFTATKCINGDSSVDRYLGLYNITLTDADLNIDQLIDDLPTGNNVPPSVFEYEVPQACNGYEGTIENIASVEGYTSFDNTLREDSDNAWIRCETRIASLGDRVWEDLNANGIQDCADTSGNGIIGDSGDSGLECNTGIDGVTVLLFQNPDGDASCTSGDEVLETSTSTMGGGFYLFPDLIAGNYCVQFTLPNGYVYTTQNQGMDSTIDSDADAVSGSTANINLLTNQTNLSVDAGVFLPASLGDLVWNDVDRDGLFNNNEPVVSGIQVELFNCTGDAVSDINGDLVEAVFTDSNGLYNFTNLKPGSYTVKFTTAAGLEFTTAVVGPDTIDSDAENFSPDGTMGTSRCITLASGENNTNVDAGIRSINESRIGDFVWIDTNANGIQDPDELGNGIIDVPVELFTCGMNDQLVSTGEFTFTNASGLYFFEGLSAGRYAVQFDLPYLNGLGFIISPRFAGPDVNANSDADLNTGATACFDLGVQDQNLSLDAGVYQPASLGDRVWLDGDGNGVLNNEDGVSSVQVELFDCSSNPVVDIFGNPVSAEFTDSSGFYNFINLIPGNYTVKFTAPSGLGFTTANVGMDDTVDSDAEIFDGDMGTTACITLGSGEMYIDADAGLIAPPAQCNLSVNATCAIIPSIQPNNFACSDAKPLDTLSMIWNGQDGVTVVAYYGKTDDSVLTSQSDVNNGDVVTISGFAGAGNDIEWKVSAANGDNLGTSRFHLSCSDAGMNGPEDCNTPQGNSKDDKPELLNDWLLDGLEGQNGVALVCNTPNTPIATAESCEYEASAGGACDSKVTNLSLRYLGGDCLISNLQGGKARCLVGGTAGNDVRIKISNGKSGDKERVFLDTVQANVQIGDIVTATAANANELDFDPNTVLEIFSSTGNLVQEVEFHTSCSLPIAIGDQYGAVDIVAMDTKSGQQLTAGVEMVYNYTIVNNSTERFVDDATDSFGLLGNLDLDALGGSVVLSRTQFVLPGVNNVFDNTLTVTGNLVPSGTACSAQDTVTVTVIEPPTPPQPDVVCDDIKPLTELSMVWNGANGTTITTAAGQVFENLNQGNLINFIVDKDAYGNDFAVTLSGGVTGSSEFHLSCSDDDMDGPDDCGTAQGDNKGNESNLNNDWAFNGMTGETGTFSCNLPNTGIVEPSDVVVTPPSNPDLTCSDIKPLSELSMVWNGANDTTVTTAAGQVFANLQQGNLINFVVDKDAFGNDFEVILSGGTTGTSEFHLSCSDDFMASYDDCGSAQGNNKGDEDNLNNEWSFDGMTGESGMFRCDLPNTGVVEGTSVTGGQVGMVHAEFRKFHDKEYKFYIHNDGNDKVYIKKITIDYPSAVNGQLVEIKNDGKKIFDKDVSASPATITDWKGKEKNRKVKAGDRNEVKIKFDKKIDTNQMEYTVEIELSTGETITVM